MTRSEQAANAIRDAHQAFQIAGIVPSPEDIRSLAITFLIEESKFGRIQIPANPPATKAPQPQEEAPAGAATAPPAPEAQDAKPFKPASPAQVKYLLKLATGSKKAILDQKMKGKDITSPFRLSSRECSAWITEFQAA